MKRNSRGARTPLWTSRQTDESVFEFRIPALENSEFEFNLLVLSDPHWDSKYCQRHALKNICDQAIEKQAAIIITGDLFDAMQHRADPRHSKGDLRPEYQCDNWLDKIVEDCAAWFAPYQNLIMVSDGNHETKLCKRLEIDLCQRFCGIINTNPGTKVYYGHYSGSIKFIFDCAKRRRVIDSHIVNYHHGTGYGTEAKQKERAGQFPDASVLTFGHHHKCKSEKLSRDRISIKGQVFSDEQILIVCPSVKDEHGTGAKGWAIEEGHRRKPTGAHWVRFFYSCIRKKILISYEPAQVI